MNVAKMDEQKKNKKIISVRHLKWLIFISLMACVRMYLFNFVQILNSSV